MDEFKDLEQLERDLADVIEDEEHQERFVIVREGMVKLTGGFYEAAVLNAMISWQRTVNRMDKNTLDQIRDAVKHGDQVKAERLKKQLRYGWFYKTAEQMAEEMFGAISRATAARIFKKLESMGFIEGEQRPNFDRKKYYRVNIKLVREKLAELGYNLDGYKLTKVQEPKNPENMPIAQNETWENPVKSPIAQNEQCTSQIEQCMSQNEQAITLHYSLHIPEDVVVVEEYRSLFASLFKETPTENEIALLLKTAREHGKDLGDCIRRTRHYADLLAEARNEKIINPVGAVHHEIVQGWNPNPLIEEIRKKGTVAPNPPEGFKPYNWLENKARV